MKTPSIGRVAVLFASMCVSSAAGAQTPAPAKPDSTKMNGPPIRRITTAAAVSTEPLGAVTSVIELRDSRVLVNDGNRRRLLLMDTTLTKVEVVLDSIAETANTYGTRAGTLIPYHGDSVLFIDPASYAMIVLDPQGKPARVRSVWRAEDLYMFTAPNGSYGYPATDSRGRIVYRVFARAAPPKVAGSIAARSVRARLYLPIASEFPTPETTAVTPATPATRSLGAYAAVRGRVPGEMRRSEPTMKPESARFAAS